MTLLTVAATAERLAVHPDTVRRLIARGDLGKVRVGRAVRVRLDDVDAYIRRGGAEVDPIAPDQVKALNAKAAAIGSATERPANDVKRGAIAAAAQHFGRKIESTLDLTWVEADWVLDRLQEAAVELGVAKIR